MRSRQIDKKNTMQVRIDKGLHRLLKIEAAKSGMTIRTLTESSLAELLAIDINEYKLDKQDKKSQNSN